MAKDSLTNQEGSTNAVLTPRQLRVLTLNVWGLAFFSKQKQVRLPAIAQRLAASDYDIVGLQEIFCESTDWRELRTRCEGRFPYSKFFYTGAFGSGLAILSRYPITSTHSHPYMLNGQPMLVNHGDWIVAKAAGCATLEVEGLGSVDVWVTHTVAAGGEDGPEKRRSHRVAQAYELASFVKRSAAMGRHVICLGDFNSTPPSLSIAVLRDVSGLSDAYLTANPNLPAHATSLPNQRGVRPDPRKCINDLGITCDSPLNTWTAGKKLDDRAKKGAGKRLDYIFFRGPHNASNQLDCQRSSVCFTDLIAGHNFSFSDHFGLEATFHVISSSSDDQNRDHTGTESTSRMMAQTLTASLSTFSSGLSHARQAQYAQFLAFLTAFGLAIVCIAFSASKTLGAGGLAAIWTTLALLCGWAGTTLLYNAVIWGEWEKRSFRTLLEAMELELNIFRSIESASQSRPSRPTSQLQSREGTNASTHTDRDGALSSKERERLVSVENDDEGTPLAFKGIGTSSPSRSDDRLI